MNSLTLHDRLRGLRVLVGNTPLFAIDFSVDHGPVRRIYAKAESLNLTGSIKDRMTLHILCRARESGELQSGGLIVEATSGNTGISFCAIGRALGHPVTIFMPDWMSAERIALIQSFGATIRIVSKEEGGFIGSITLAEALTEAGRPGRTIDGPGLDAHAAGALLMHFMLETIVAGRLLGLDPFDQPAVELAKILTRQRLGA